MGATRVSVGRLEFGWSRYDYPKRFSLRRFFPGFWRFKWRTFRFYVSWHRFFVEPTNDSAAWGGDL
jgi:hypothetical protein